MSIAGTSEKIIAVTMPQRKEPTIKPTPLWSREKNQHSLYPCSLLAKKDFFCRNLKDRSKSQLEKKFIQRLILCYENFQGVRVSTENFSNCQILSLDFPSVSTFEENFKHFLCSDSLAKRHHMHFSRSFRRNHHEKILPKETSSTT